MKKIIITGSIANSLEWYDFALYAHFASIFGKKFFPEFDQNAALLATLSVFAVGFLMRPVGAILFGIIGDKHGRKTSLSIAIILMSIPTALVGLLPSYKTIGIAAPILLCVLRMIQGLSLGGALVGSVSYIIEHSKKKHRGLAGSAPIFSLCLGFILGSIVVWLFSTFMSEQSFDSYGWRIPFFLGLPAMAVSYYLKNHAKESPEFQSAKDNGMLVAKPLNSLVTSYKSVILSSISLNALGSVGFYTLAVFIGRYLENTKSISVSDISLIETCTMIFVMFSVLVAGYLSDIIGQRKWFIIISIITIICAYPIIHFIQFGGFIEIVLAQFLFAFLVGSWIGPEPAMQMSLFPTNVRSTGVSLSYNLGCTIFGGTAPAISQYFFEYYQNINFVVYYIIISAFISILALLKLKDYRLKC